MKPFEFCMLRFLPDLVRDEFLNLGVVVHVPGEFLGARFDLRADCLRAMFGLEDASHLETWLEDLAAHIQGLGHPHGSPDSTLADLAARFLPPDDSALQWSEVGRGLTDEPEKELKRMFERLVCSRKPVHVGPHVTRLG